MTNRDVGWVTVATLPGSWHGEEQWSSAPGDGAALHLAMEDSWTPDPRADR